MRFTLCIMQLLMNFVKENIQFYSHSRSHAQGTQKTYKKKKISEFCGKMPRDLGARWKRICFSGAAKQYVFFFMLTVFTNEQSIISRYIIICQCYRYSLQFYYARKQMPSTLINAINAEWAKNPFNILHS